MVKNHIENKNSMIFDLFSFQVYSMCIFSCNHRDLGQSITSSEARGVRNFCQLITSSEARGLRDVGQSTTSSEARGSRDVGQPTTSSETRG